MIFFFFKQKTAYEMRISDWSSDVCSSDLWLPGSEGEGVADVLIGDAAGRPRFDFAGTLPAAWPRTPDMADGALFPLGYGLTYASPATPWAPLPEVAVDAAADRHSWLDRKSTRLNSSH